MKDCIACVIRRHLSLKSMVFRLAGFLLLCVAIGSSAQAGTAITPTTGVGNLGTHVLPPSGNVYGITGGKPVGNNLYHSFAQFNVGTGDIAQFQTSTLIPNAAMHNILGRITDTNPSIIFGTIDSATYYPGANLFLMNPYGFLFGPNAMLNIGGMAAFTTADYLKLANNVLFEAIPGAQDALLSAFPVAAFGFLGSNPAAISVQGSTLSVQTGQSVALVGGSHGFTYTNPDTGATASVPDGVTLTGGMLSAPSGEINIVGVASAGEVSAGDFMPTSGMTMGNIALSQGAILDVSGDSGGTVRIRGGQFIMDQSAVIANTTGASDGAPTAISVNVTDAVLLNNQSTLVAQATNAGRGGDIEITGRTIDVAGASVVYTASADSGSPGNITANASESISVRGTDQFGNPSEILSDSLALASTGSITLRSPLITLSEMGAVETRMFGFGAGARAGDITIEATNLNLINGGMIRTTSGSDIAPSGNISITAGEAVNLIGTNDFNTTSNITNENITGRTGNISVQTGSLTLSDQARINSQTWFEADPAAANQAKISIAADSITLSTGSRIDVGGFFSDTGRLNLSAQNLTMSGVSAITTLSNGSGAAGPILINVQDLSVSEGSQIVSSSGQGFGRGGDITVNATGSVLVTGQGTDPFGGTVGSGIFSNTMAGFEDPSFTGNAGNISITGHSIEVSHGARVDSSSQLLALGNAGNIDLMAPTITVNGGTISTSTEFAGQAGTITLRADTVTLSNAGQLANSSIVRQTPLFDGEVIPLPSGNAGSVLLEGKTSPAQSVLIDGAGSGIFTDTKGSGAGGNIMLNANTVTLQNGGMLSAATAGTEVTATGGSITVDANQVQLNSGAMLKADTSSPGNAGNISITGQESITLHDSFIKSGVDTPITTGDGGTVQLTAPTIALQNSRITAATSGPGNAGNIDVAAGNLSLTGNSRLLARTTSGGNAGDITIHGLTGPESTAQSVALTGSSLILADTFGNRDPLGDNFSLEGSGGNISIVAGQLLLDSSGVTTAATSSSGAAGIITIRATEGVTISQSSLTSNSESFSLGDAGMITVSSPNVIIQNGGLISTSTDFIGKAGPIEINTGSLQVRTGGQITSSSLTIAPPEFPELKATGPAGNITIQGFHGPAASIVVDGAGSGIFTDTQGTGAGGNIFVNANTVTLQNGGTLSAKTSGTEVTATGGTITVDATDTVTMKNSASITASSTGTADAGSVNITGSNGFTMQNSTITTLAGQGASGGNIKVTTSPEATVLLTNNSLISASVADGPGGGGNISIDPQFVILQNSQILAQAAQGQGGAITITANLFLPDANSIVNADSGSGVNGTVTIQSPNDPAGGKIQPLGKSPLQATSLLNQRCASLAGGEFSSFTVAGRDSLPTEPSSWLVSPLALGPVGFSAGTVTEGGAQARVIEPVQETTVLSLRQIAPAGFLTQTFAVDWSTGCQS